MATNAATAMQLAATSSLSNTNYGRIIVWDADYHRIQISFMLFSNFCSPHDMGSRLLFLLLCTVKLVRNIEKMFSLCSSSTLINLIHVCAHAPARIIRPHARA
jgi:hypothetical protein